MLELSEQSLEQDTHVITVRGELDVGSAGPFTRALNAAVEARRCVVLDFADLTFIDSTGMMVLLGGLRRVERGGGCLVVACTNPTVLRIFALTGMDKTFSIETMRQRAIDLARDTIERRASESRGSGE